MPTSPMDLSYLVKTARRLPGTHFRTAPDRIVYATASFSVTSRDGMTTLRVSDKVGSGKTEAKAVEAARQGAIAQFLNNVRNNALVFNK